MYSDTEILNWIIFYTPKIIHIHDGDSCYLEYLDNDDDYEFTITSYFNNPREAIIHEINRQKGRD